MNLALHGIPGNICQANSYYECLRSATGKFDFVMASSASDARSTEAGIRRQIWISKSGSVFVQTTRGVDNDRNGAGHQMLAKVPH
jgi:hypothetical protein